MRPLEPLPVVRAADLDDAPLQAHWLIHPLWARAAVGILGGAPKCMKSWLALDIALSVASGTPALDTFDVQDKGSVLLFMAEDATAVVKRRLQGICDHRRLALADLPLHVITAPSLRLDRDVDQRRLYEAARRHAPRLLLLDPFVRLHRIDENDAGQVAGLLGYLRHLQRELDLSVLVVHHARKNGSAAQPGQSLRGSGDLHAWGDSNLYVRRNKDILTLTVEHRAAKAPEPIRLQLVDDHRPHLALVAAEEDPPDGDLDHRIVQTLSAASAPLSRARLRDALHVRNERLGDAIARLHDAGLLVRHGDRWAVPVPTHTHAPERNGSRQLSLDDARSR